MTEIVKCEVCGEPMPQGETMFKFHGYSGPCPKPPLAKPYATEPKELKWPEGYCLDPNGKMNIPFGKEEDFNFGYEIGFKEALAIRNSAENAALKEQVAQLQDSSIDNCR